jgi:WD40 repeat protein
MVAVPGVTHLTVAPDGSWLAAAGAGGVHLVDPDTGEWRELLSTGSSDPSPGDEVRTLAVAPDGSWLAVAFAGRPVRVWDTADGRLRHAFPTDGLGAAVLAVAPDGSWLAASDGGPDSRLRLWDPRTGASRGWLPGTHSVRSLVVAPDGSWMATGATGAVVVLDPAGTRRGAEMAQALPVNDLVVSGSWIATAHHDGVRIWDRHASTPRSWLPLSGEVTSVAAGPTWLAAGTLHGVHLWDAESGRALHTFSAAVRWGRELTAPADGAWFAAAGGSSPVHVWDTITGHPRLVVPEGTAPVIAAPDGSWLAVCTQATRAVEIWDLATGTRRHVLNSEMQVAALTVSADSNRLGAAHGPLSPFMDYVWDVRTGEPCAPSDAPTGEPVSSGGYHVNGQSLLRIWDGLPTELRHLVANDHRRDRLDVDRLATSPDGQWLAALSGGLLSSIYSFAGELRVYDLRSARTAARMPLRTKATGVGWSADGSDLFVWGSAGLYKFAWVTEAR